MNIYIYQMTKDSHSKRNSNRSSRRSNRRSNRRHSHRRESRKWEIDIKEREQRTESHKREPDRESRKRESDKEKKEKCCTSIITAIGNSAFDSAEKVNQVIGNAELEALAGRCQGEAYVRAGIYNLFLVTLGQISNNVWQQVNQCLRGCPNCCEGVASEIGNLLISEYNYATIAYVSVSANPTFFPGTATPNLQTVFALIESAYNKAFTTVFQNSLNCNFVPLP
jgi:hypothetical protein